MKSQDCIYPRLIQLEVIPCAGRSLQAIDEISTSNEASAAIASCNQTRGRAEPGTIPIVRLALNHVSRIRTMKAQGNPFDIHDKVPSHLISLISSINTQMVRKPTAI